MTAGEAGGTQTPVRALFKEMVTVVTEERAPRLKEIARVIWREPFARRTWSEFSFLVIGAMAGG